MFHSAGVAVVVKTGDVNPEDQKSFQLTEQQGTNQEQETEGAVNRPQVMTSKMR